MLFKNIMWIGIFVLVALVLLIEEGVKVPDKAKDVVERVERVVDEQTELRQQAYEKDRYAGTTKSREFQEAWEEASARVEAEYEANTYPQFVWNIIDSGKF